MDKIFFADYDLNPQPKIDNIGINTFSKSAKHDLIQKYVCFFSFINLI